MKPPEHDAAHLWDMLDAARQAASFSLGLDLDQLLDDLRTRYAVERALEIIGEAARRVSLPTRNAHPDIPWAGIIGFRNVLAHEYGAIDYRRLYTVLQKDVPKLVTQLEEALSRMDEGS
jgi:uncharacterized protein with HEPN domain